MNLELVCTTSTQSKSSSAAPRSLSSGINQDVLWQELVSRHTPGLKNRLRRALNRLGILESDDQIEDLAQEVYRRLIQHHGKSLEDGPARCELTLAAYLGRAAESAAVDRLRYQLAAKRNLRLSCSLSHPWIAAKALRVPDPQWDPEQWAIQRQAMALLIRQLRRASPGSSGRVCC